MGTDNTSGDQTILELIREANTRQEGFRALIKKYQERLYWVVRRIVPTHQDADEVLQDALVKICQGIDGFEGRSALYTWMYTITRHEALRHRKSTKNPPVVALEDLKDQPSSQYDSLWIDGDDMWHRLTMAVNRLPPKQKKVFEMKYFDDLKYSQISDLLGTSVGALKASYHHAIQKIKSDLTK